MKPFEHKDLESPNFLQKLLKKQPTKNLLIELNNKLVSVTNINDITPSYVDDVSSKWNTSMIKIDISERKNMLKDFVNYVYKEPIPSNILIEQIETLSSLLMLSKAEQDSIAIVCKKDAFLRLCNEILNNSTDFTYPELVDLLTFDDNMLTQLKEMAFKKYSNSLMTEIGESHLYSKEQEKKFTRAAEILDVSMSFDDKTQKTLDNYRTYWNVSHNPLQEIEVPINLQRNEKCYFTLPVDFLELNKVTTRVNYSGPTFRVRIAKGLYYRMGSIAPQRISKDVLTKVDEGELYITNKRAIFVGGKKTANTLYSKILDVDLYSDGIALKKDSGKTPLYKNDEKSELLYNYICKAIAEYNC